MFYVCSYIVRNNYVALNCLTSLFSYIGREMNDLLNGVLRRIFKCDFNMVNDVTMTTFLSMSNSLAPYLDCSKHSSNDCIRVITKACMESSVRSVKVIRLPMSIDVIQDLLTLIPDLKIIHLLRDPRGKLSSPYISKAGRNTNKSLVTKAATSLCNEMDDGIFNRTFLEKLYPQQFLQVIYEDMAESVTEVARQVMAFVGLPYNDQHQSILLASVTGKEEKGGLNVMRDDPVSTAYSWRTRLSYSNVQAIDDVCENLHGRLKMTKVTSESDLRDLNQTHRIYNDKIKAI